MITLARYRRCRYASCHAMVEFPNHYCTQHFEHEAEYLANRERWARGNSKEHQQKYDKQVRNRNVTKQEQYKFYRTKQWVELRKQCLYRDHGLCRYCKARNGRVSQGTTIDHTVPIEFEPSLKADIDNLACICRECHRLKTQWEQSYYGTGSNNQLKNVPVIKDVTVIDELMHSQNA